MKMFLATDKCFFNTLVLYSIHLCELLYMLVTWFINEDKLSHMIHECFFQLCTVYVCTSLVSLVVSETKCLMLLTRLNDAKISPAWLGTCALSLSSAHMHNLQPLQRLDTAY